MMLFSIAFYFYLFFMKPNQLIIIPHYLINEQGHGTISKSNSLVLNSFVSIRFENVKFMNTKISFELRVVNASLSLI